MRPLPSHVGTLVRALYHEYLLIVFAWIITSGLLTKYFKAGDCETGIIFLEGIGWVISITKPELLPSGAGPDGLETGSGLVVVLSGLVIITGSGSVVVLSGLVIITGSGSVIMLSGLVIIVAPGSVVVLSGLLIIVAPGSVVVLSVVIIVPFLGLVETIVSHGGSMVVHSSFVPLDPSGGGKRSFVLAHQVVVKDLLAHQVVVKDLLAHQVAVESLLVH